MERRRTLRVPTNQPVTVDFAGEVTAVGELRDVSFDGAFLVPNSSRPESFRGKYLRVHVDAASVAGSGPLEIPALVVRVARDGVGLEFDAYDDRASEYLERVQWASLGPARVFSR